MTNLKKKQVTREELLKRIEGAVEEIELAEFELADAIRESEVTGEDYGCGYGDAVARAYRDLDFVVSLLEEHDKKH